MKRNASKAVRFAGCSDKEGDTASLAAEESIPWELASSYSASNEMRFPCASRSATVCKNAPAGAPSITR